MDRGCRDINFLLFSSENSPPTKPSPVCGGIAILLPLFGGVLGYAIVVGKPAGDAGWPHVLLGPLVLPASALFGLAVSGVSFLRRERHPLVSWLGVLVNIALLVYGIARLR